MKTLAVVLSGLILGYLIPSLLTTAMSARAQSAAPGTYELVIMIWVNDAFTPNSPPPPPGIALYTARQIVNIPTANASECARLENTFKWAKGCFAFDAGTECGGMPMTPGGPNDVRANGYWILGCFQEQ